MKNIWLLSRKGILNHDGSLLPDVPFKNCEVTTGDVYSENVVVTDVPDLFKEKQVITPY